MRGVSDKSRTWHSEFKLERNYSVVRLTAWLL
jgi:hypothetical protein